MMMEIKIRMTDVILNVKLSLAGNVKKLNVILYAVMGFDTFFMKFVMMEIRTERMDVLAKLFILRNLYATLNQTMKNIHQNL